MKQSTSTIFCIIFSLLITLLNARVVRKNATQEQLVIKHSIRASVSTGATLMITDYEKGGDSGQPAKCDGVYQSNNLFLVSLPSTWYKHGDNCYKGVNISYNNVNVIALAVDECDSGDGCSDDDLVASNAVWRGLQVPESQWGVGIQVIWLFVN
ncbi:putative ripening-related protein 1 [Rutidosis leptorrhynchoides]|uniref:putative ripening-related protein 1 n=1 Tax=Rutidosis leptorrhynchoides TaxID=125765 RepID=UPI003A997E64